tara:strand:+ start:797 stop:1615 length:819 start_codon:yes stop_codon:yes gene_type:complete
MMQKAILVNDFQGREFFIDDLKNIFRKRKFFLRCQSIVPVSERSKGSTSYEILIGFDKTSFTDVMNVSDLVENLEFMGRSVLMDHLVMSGVVNASIIEYFCTDEYSRLHLNLSGHSINKSYFMARILRLLRCGVLPPNRICFELTETAKIDDLQKTATFLHQAKELGCSFALDDFGKGFSSLDYVVNLPIDTIKIDGSIIKHVATNSRARAALKSIVALASEVGADTVAECVENLKQFYVVKEMGVDFIQGALVGMPKPFYGSYYSKKTYTV